MLKPRPYQDEAIQLLHDRPNLIIADDCGTGKTLIPIEYVRQALIGPVLVVCPPKAIVQWAEAIKEQMPEARVINPGRLPYDYREQWLNFDWALINWNDLVHPSATTLGDMVWPLVVADEAHRAKNRKSLRAEELWRLPAGRRVGLTATPYEHREEIFSLLKWLDPETFSSYWNFLSEYFVTRAGYFGGTEVVKLKDPEAFARLESRYMIRRTMEQVMPDLPPLIETHVSVPMSSKQQEVYDTIKNSADAIVQVDDVEVMVLNALALLSKLRQVSSYPQALGFDIPSEKLDWCMEFIEDHPKLRTVFFTVHVDIAKDLAQRLDCEALVAGEGSAEPFRKGRAQHLVMNIASGGEALDLYMGDASVFVESDWSSVRMYQAVRRIYRGNINERKLVYYLNSSPTDTYVFKCSKKKMTERELAMSLIEDIRKGNML